MHVEIFNPQDADIFKEPIGNVDVDRNLKE